MSKRLGQDHPECAKLRPVLALISRASAHIGLARYAMAGDGLGIALAQGHSSGSLPQAVLHCCLASVQSCRCPLLSRESTTTFRSVEAWSFGGMSSVLENREATFFVRFQSSDETTAWQQQWRRRQQLYILLTCRNFNVVQSHWLAVSFRRHPELQRHTQHFHISSIAWLCSASSTLSVDHLSFMTPIFTFGPRGFAAPCQCIVRGFQRPRSAASRVRSLPVYFKMPCTLPKREVFCPNV